MKHNAMYGTAYTVRWQAYNHMLWLGIILLSAGYCVKKGIFKYL